MKNVNTHTFPNTDVHGTQNCRTKSPPCFHITASKSHRTLSGPTDPLLRKHQDLIEAYQGRQLRGLQEHRHRTDLRGDQRAWDLWNRCSRWYTNYMSKRPPKTTPRSNTALAHTFEIDVHARPFFTCISDTEFQPQNGGGGRPTRGEFLLEDTRTPKRKRCWGKNKNIFIDHT